MIRNSRSNNRSRKFSTEKEFYDWVDVFYEQLDSAILESNIISKYYQFLDVLLINRTLLNQETYKIYKDECLQALMAFGWDLKQRKQVPNQEAWSVFRKALRLEPVNPLAHYRLGHIAFMNCKMRPEPEALDRCFYHFSQAINLNAKAKQDYLKLNFAQLSNAEATLLIVIVKKMLTDNNTALNLSDRHEFLSFQNMLQNLHEDMLIYITIKGEKRIETTLTRELFLLKLSELEDDKTALVINNANVIPEISYMKNGRELHGDRLFNLLRVIGCDPNTPQGLSVIDPATGERTLTPANLRQILARLRDTLRYIGLSEDKFSISNHASEVSYTTNLTIHYFKNILR